MEKDEKTIEFNGTTNEFEPVKGPGDPGNTQIYRPIRDGGVPKNYGKTILRRDDHRKPGTGLDDIEAEDYDIDNPLSDFDIDGGGEDNGYLELKDEDVKKYLEENAKKYDMTQEQRDQLIDDFTINGKSGKMDVYIQADVVDGELVYKILKPSNKPGAKKEFGTIKLVNLEKNGKEMIVELADRSKSVYMRTSRGKLVDVKRLPYQRGSGIPEDATFDVLGEIFTLTKDMVLDKPDKK